MIFTLYIWYDNYQVQVSQYTSSKHVLLGSTFWRTSKTTWPWQSGNEEKWYYKLNELSFPPWWNLLRIAWPGKAEVVKSPKLQLDESVLNAGQPEIVWRVKINRKEKQKI